jgi:hypothetical protein
MLIIRRSLLPKRNNPAVATPDIPPGDQCLQAQAYPISDSTHDIVPCIQSLLAKYLSLDKLFSSASMIILSLNVGYPAALLYAPTEFSGLKLPCYSDLAQLQKWGSIHRALNLGGESRLAATELLERMQNSDTSLPSCFGSLAEWGKLGGLALHNTEPLIPEHRSAERIDIQHLQDLLRLCPDQTADEWSGGSKIFIDGSFTPPILFLTLNGMLGAKV